MGFSPQSRMSHARVVSSFLIVAAAVWALRGVGQAQLPLREIRQLIAPPAIDRGVAPDRAPDPNTVTKRSSRQVRSASAVLDRTG